MSQDGYVDMETVKKRKKSALNKKNDENYENGGPFDNYEEPLPETRINKEGNKGGRSLSPTDNLYEDTVMQEVEINTPKHQVTRPQARPAPNDYGHKRVYIIIGIVSLLCVVTLAIAIAGLVTAIKAQGNSDALLVATTGSTARTANQEYSRILKMAGWYRASNGYWYKISSVAHLYRKAKTSCELYDGRLASGVKNTTVLSELFSSILTPTGRATWIGLQSESSGWIWSDGSSWVRGQTGTFSPAANATGCGALLINDTPTFSNTDCTSENFYLCESKIAIY